jgi:hypothetical protein
MLGGGRLQGIAGIALIRMPTLVLAGDRLHGARQLGDLGRSLLGAGVT